MSDNLTQADREALIEAFAHGAPIGGKELAVMTGLVPADLLALGIVHNFERWPDIYYPGANFPKKGS